MMDIFGSLESEVRCTLNISAFAVGDRLMWGGAEPLRRMLNIATGRL